MSDCTIARLHDCMTSDLQTSDPQTLRQRTQPEPVEGRLCGGANLEDERYKMYGLT